MPLGDEQDKHSAFGIINGLGQRARVVVATAQETSATSKNGQMLGCVLGAVADQKLITDYGLSDFDARAGDGILAYIGISPAIQGGRLRELGDGRFDLAYRGGEKQAALSGQSLASLLFSRWLQLDQISSCPHVFLRTRKCLSPIIHLARKNDFQYRGHFYLDFQGHRQDRIIFERTQNQLLS